MIPNRFLIGSPRVFLALTWQPLVPRQRIWSEVSTEAQREIIARTGESAPGAAWESDHIRMMTVDLNRGLMTVSLNLGEFHKFKGLILILQPQEVYF